MSAYGVFNMTLYKITNLINGKLYIGQTTSTIAKRWTGHKTPSSRCKGIARAIKKYGKSNFKIEVMATANNQQELDHRESYYISLFNTLAPNGYNLTSGGVNKKYAAITLKRLSIARTGLKMKTPAWNKGLSSWSKGLQLSASHKRAISDSRNKIAVIDSIGRTFISISEAAKAIGSTSGKICAVIKGTRKSVKGLRFEVLNVNN